MTRGFIFGAAVTMAAFVTTIYGQTPQMANQEHEENAHVSADATSKSSKTSQGLHEHEGKATFELSKEGGKGQSGSASGKLVETAKGEYHVEVDANVKKLNKKQLGALFKNAVKGLKAQQTAKGNDVRTQSNKQTAQSSNNNFPRRQPR